MADISYTALSKRIATLEKNYESLEQKVDLLIHSVNNLYDEIDKNNSCCYHAEDDEELDVPGTSATPSVKEDKLDTSTEGIADIILALFEALEERKK